MTIVRISQATAVLALCLLAAQPAAAEDLADAALSSVPLILKDGRIAKVTVHTIPFEVGQAALSEAGQDQLQNLASAMATDCFLTAQIIGHVDEAEAVERKTIEAHGLSRARADLIHQSLVAKGLANTAIASVWDWQFLVKEPRATVWVFNLASGEECSEQPLMAQVETEQSVSPLPPMPVQRPLSLAGPVAEPMPRQAIAPAVADDQRPGTNADASITPASAPRHGGDDGKVASLDGGNVEIVFATNSSFFPSGTTRQLESALDRLSKKGEHRISVRAAISTEEPVAGADSPEEAMRYHRWIAERRLERVTNWIKEHADGRRIAIDEGYIEDDSSRRVVVELATTS